MNKQERGGNVVQFRKYPQVFHIEARGYFVAAAGALWVFVGQMVGMTTAIIIVAGVAASLDRAYHLMFAYPLALMGVGGVGVFMLIAVLHFVAGPGWFMAKGWWYSKYYYLLLTEEGLFVMRKRDDRDIAVLYRSSIYPETTGRVCIVPRLNDFTHSLQNDAFYIGKSDRVRLLAYSPQSIFISDADAYYSNTEELIQKKWMFSQEGGFVYDWVLCPNPTKGKEEEGEVI